MQDRGNQDCVRCFCLGCQFLVLACLVPGILSAQAPDMAVRGYFQQIGLPGLVIEQMHAEWQRSESDAERALRAELLIAQYSQQVLEGQPNSVHFVWDAGRMDRVEASSRIAPTPAWRLAVLAARLQAAGLALENERREGGSAARRGELLREVELVVRGVEQVRDAVVLPGGGTGPVPAFEADPGRLQFRALTLLASAAVLLVENGEPNPEWMELANRSLARILQLGDASVAAGQLEVFVPWQSWQLAVIEDFAVCQLRGGQDKALESAVGAIGRGFGSPAAEAARIRILARSGRSAELVTYVRGLPVDDSPLPGRLELWTALLAVLDWIPVSESAAAEELQLRAFAALARSQGSLLLRALEQPHPGIPAFASVRFYGNWIAGSAGLVRFRDQANGRISGWTSGLPPWLVPGVEVESSASGSSGRLEDSIRLLLAAEGEWHPGLALADLGCCRLAVAEAAKWKEDWAVAESFAGKALEDLKSSGCAVRAAEAASLWLEARTQRAALGLVSEAELLELSQRMASEFSGSITGGLAEQQVRILELRRRPAGEAASFWRVQLTRNPGDWNARTELVAQLLRRSQEVPSPDNIPVLQEAADSTLALLMAEGATPATGIRACSALLMAGSGAGQWMESGFAGKLVAGLEKAARRPGLSGVLRGELFWCIHELAAVSGETGRQKAALEWLLSHPETADWHRRALLARAQELEYLFSVSADGGPISPPEEPLLGQVTDLYARLVDRLGVDADTLRDQPNARLAATRLVTLHVWGNRPEQALELGSRVLEAFPQDRAMLVEAARLAGQLGQSDRATGFWRRAAQLQEAGSEGWREARLQWYRGLQKTDAEAADAVRRQTLELDPEMPGEWKDRFGGNGNSG